MNLFVKFLQDNGFKNAESAEVLSASLDWISSLNSPFIAWLFERIEYMRLLDADGQVRLWNGLTAKAPRNELDHLQAQIHKINQETLNIETKCHELKLAMYDANQENALLKADIQQKRERINFQDHTISETSDKIDDSLSYNVGRIQDQALRLDSKEYAFQKTEDIDIFKSSCIQNINSLLEKYQMLVSEMGQLKVSDEACFELDRLISTYPVSFMNQLKAQLKLVELQAQMDELEKMPHSEHVLMNENEGHNFGSDAKFQLTSSITSLLKEVKALLTRRACHTITLQLHEKLTNKMAHISNQILNLINVIQNILQNFSLSINSLIQKISLERKVLQDMISSSQVFEQEIELWKKEHTIRMKSVEPAIKMSKSLIKSNHSFVVFLNTLFGIVNDSQSDEVTLLPIDTILESLVKEKAKWNCVLKEYHTAIDKLEELTVQRVYREQSLLQARLNNAEAPYILPHDRRLYEFDLDVKNEVEKLQKQLALVTELF